MRWGTKIDFCTSFAPQIAESFSCVETYCAEILCTHNIFVIDLHLAAIVNICDEILMPGIPNACTTMADE